MLLPDGSEHSHDWVYWGVARITVDDLPDGISTDGNVTYDFTVEHDPIVDNYGHAELRVYKGGRRESNSKKINQQVKKKYRTILALKTSVIVNPLV